jgi:uncharacterized protein YecE (DUF72 family)
MSILVGTCAWTDPSLVRCGRFYPQEIASSPEWRLRYYATRFPIVEVDSSYYAIPAPGAARHWAERTPDDFVFNVKAFRAFTGHQTSLKVLHKDLQQALAADVRPTFFYRDLGLELQDELWRRFIDALEPLRVSGKLGLVHFQFPPWIVCDERGRRHVAHCVERMAGHTVSVEFRHVSWFSPASKSSTLAFERELEVVHTVVDAPQGSSNTVPAVWETTHPQIALLRLHGRNAATWNVKGTGASSDRFNYDYADVELAELAGRVGQLAASVPRTHALLNNNFEDQGQRNALRLRFELEQLGLAVKRPTSTAGLHF